MESFNSVLGKVEKGIEFVESEGRVLIDVLHSARGLVTALSAKDFGSVFLSVSRGREGIERLAAAFKKKFDLE